jgi:hypothetical protein
MVFDSSYMLSVSKCAGKKWYKLVFDWYAAFGISLNSSR